MVAGANDERGLRLVHFHGHALQPSIRRPVVEQAHDGRIAAKRTIREGVDPEERNAVYLAHLRSSPWVWRDHPARGPLGHANVRIITLGLWRRQKNERRVQARGFVRAANQLASDPLALISLVNRQIGQISAKAKIGNGARHTYQRCAVACGDDDVGVLQHGPNAARVVDRPPLAQRRAHQYGQRIPRRTSRLQDDR